MTLHISNLSKRYGNNWVLRDVSFDVEKGAVLGLVGGTQCGKSTLLRILAGRENPTSKKTSVGLESRSVYFSGEVAPRRIGLFGRTIGTRHSALNSLERSIDQATDLLILDDPLSGVDRELRDDYLTRIRRLANEKAVTVLFATSDFETAALVSDRIAVLSGSYIQQVGSSQELYENPISAPVARLTGRCNIFKARRLTSTKYEIPEFQTIDGNHRLFAEKADIAKLGAINRNVLLAIRPENISMSFGASFPEDNLLKAVVTGIKFLGPVTQVELDAGGLLLNTLVFRLVGLNIGQECMLGLPPDRIKILKD
jgi:ABC-type Fe3+/spermidine/putrescine transport system ATPase subunit